jgi:hypothetical protein
MRDYPGRIRRAQALLEVELRRAAERRRVPIGSCLWKSAQEDDDSHLLRDCRLMVVATDLSIMRFCFSEAFLSDCESSKADRTQANRWAEWRAGELADDYQRRPARLLAEEWKLGHGFRVVDDVGASHVFCRLSQFYRTRSSAGAAAWACGRSSYQGTRGQIVFRLDDGAFEILQTDPETGLLLRRTTVPRLGDC